MNTPPLDFEYYKDVLKQALAFSDKLTVATKQKMLALKEALTEYTNLLEKYDEDTPNEGGMNERSNEESELESLHKELNTLSTEILREVDVIKNAVV